MKRNTERLNVLHEYGWSETNQNQFFQFADKIIGDTFKGTFTIKRVKGSWFWYFKFSNNKITPRTKYLCSCEVKLNNKQSSFQYATQIFLEKINHDFSNKNVIEPNISRYIDEYIDVCLRDGGLIKSKRENRVVLIQDTGGSKTKNSSTMKRRILTLGEFRKFCLKEGVKTILVSKQEFREVFRKYFFTLRDRTKKNREGNSIGEKKLSRATIKLHLQQVRMFLEWLVKPSDMGGKGLIKQHQITAEYQNFLLEESFGEVVRKDKIYNDFSLSNYRKSSEDCIKYIRTIWNLYCKYDGDRETIRRERLSYNEKLKDGTFSGKIHANQTRELIVLSDVVFFISLLQLKYGFRISEILQSYRNYEMWDLHEKNKSTQVSSYFRKEESDNDELDYYVLEIQNSKKKYRQVPIADTIYSWVKPPKGIPFRKVKDENLKYDVWETNIIDVIFELFHPKEHPRTFPSPNLNEKPNKGYSTNYYLNLFKEKFVNDGVYNWDNYGIQTTHNLRSYFVSYMFLEEGASIELVCRISGHSYQTAHQFYQRINSKSLQETLEINSIKNILQKNRLKQSLKKGEEE